MQSCPGVSSLGLQHMSVIRYIPYSVHSCDRIPNRIKSGRRISYGSWFQIWTHQGRKGWLNSPCPAVGGCDQGCSHNIGSGTREARTTAWITFTGPCPSDPLTSKVLPPKVSRTSHNRTTCWEPRIQSNHLPGNISHSNPKGKDGINL